MTTIKDIARLAGVSIATVSRVLNGQSGVSESKRQKVLQVAEETHYSLNRFAAGIKEKVPHVLVLLTAEHEAEQTQEELLEACAEAVKLFSADSLQVEYYNAGELPRAIELLQKIQDKQEDLEGLIIIGKPPESLRRYLSYLRGRGCPMILIGAYDDELSPLSLIQYEYSMYYAMLAELIPLFDRERKALIFHESPASLSGEGAFSLPGFDFVTENLRELYPCKAIYRQNKGAFAPEIFPEGSCLVLDSVAATRIAIARYEQAEKRPAIIGYGNEPDLQDALMDGRLTALIHLSAYELAFRSSYALLQRLLLKRSIPRQQFVFPMLYLKSMLPQMKFKRRFKVLLSESGEEEE